MLYELLVPLAKYHTAFNVFRYITFRTAMATVTALVISFITQPRGTLVFLAAWDCSGWLARSQWPSSSPSASLASRWWWPAL